MVLLSNLSALPNLFKVVFMIASMVAKRTVVGGDKRAAGPKCLLASTMLNMSIVQFTVVLGLFQLYQGLGTQP